MDIERRFKHDGHDCHVQITNLQYDKIIRLGRHQNGRVECFSFDSNGIYVKRYVSGNPDDIILDRVSIRYLDVLNIYDCFFDYHTENTLNQHGNFYRALMRLKVGQTINDWLHIGMDIYFHPEKYGCYGINEAKYIGWKSLAKDNPIIRHITCGKISFARMPENKNNKSFDFIKISVCISAVDNKMEFVQKNYKSIIGYVLKRIEKSKRFAKFDVPIGILKVGSCVLSHDGYIYITFEIKNELREVFENDTSMEVIT